MFAYGELDIFLAMLEIRYMLISFAFDIDMCHRLPRRAYRVAKQHIEPQAISSDTKWHISMLKLLFAETNNSFNVPCPRKKIESPHRVAFITVFLESFYVSSKCCRIAGDVNYFSWVES